MMLEIQKLFYCYRIIMQGYITQNFLNFALKQIISGKNT